MRHFIKFALFCAAIGWTGTAFAEASATYRDGTRALFSFAVPDFWTMQAGGKRLLAPSGEDVKRPVPQVISMRPTIDPTVWMGFLSPPGISTLADGRAYLAEIAAFLGGEPKVAGRVSRRIGGLPAEVIRGTGKRDGRALSFDIAVIDLPGDRIAIAAAVVEAGTDPAFVDEINRVFASFRAGS